ncbi:Imm63 family immunity protein [Nocardia sp. CDC153]|uniref:Imm63 family immunity protein n=1 Tax=Nocardia sp. CDC153 TaxID=3112167 RepID=UPI002DB88A68|nr:Imm63 family immunity protein [Nocardia sp. CDC153]MEC3956495.1 Imm63 family immunity protein [Nocardia sp. CDC153]
MPFDPERIQQEVMLWVDRLHRVAPHPAAQVPAMIADEHGHLNFAEPFFRVTPERLTFEAWERDKQILERPTTSPAELAYWIVDHLAKQIALDTVHRHKSRPPTLDARRIWFPEWHRLVHAVHPDWGTRTLLNINGILAEYPFH